MTHRDVFGRIHLPAYAIVAGSLLVMCLVPSPLQALITSLVAIALVVNIELLGVSRYETFDPSPVLLSIILLIHGLVSYAGIDRPYIVLLAIASASVLISASYWEEPGYTIPYTPLLPIALFTAPLAGILVGAGHPFLYTLVSMLETSVLYGVNTWKTGDAPHLLAHVLVAASLYGLVYLMTGELVVTLLISTTYFVKYLATGDERLSAIYPSMDPFIKTILEGVLG